MSVGAGGRSRIILSLDQSQTAAGAPSRAPKPAHLVAGFRPEPVVSACGVSRRGSLWAPAPAGQILSPEVAPYSSLFAVVTASPHRGSARAATTPSDGPTASKAQLRQEGTHNPGEGRSRSVWLRWPGETVPLGPTGRLLHKATL